MRRSDLRLGAKAPRLPLSSRLSIRSAKSDRLKKLTKTTWVPAGSGLMQLRRDTYKMKSNISKQEQAIFERRGIRFAKGFRPYSHRVGGIAREGPLRKDKTVHGIETRRVPTRALRAAANGKLPTGPGTYRRFFRGGN